MHKTGVYKLYILFRCAIVRVKYIFGLYEMKKLLYNKLNCKKGAWAVNCMKCGREISEGQVFCEDCLKIMEQYPVRPGTYVRIPPRKDYEELRPPRRKKELTPEEHLAQLQEKIRWLSVSVVALMATSILLGFLVLQDFLTPEEETSAPMVRNYTVTQTDEN